MPKKECIIATGFVDSSSHRFLSVDLDVLPVIEWTDNHLVYTNEYPICMNYQYTLDWVTKSVTGIRLKKPEMKNKESCKEYKEELRLTLKDGYEVYEDEKEKASPPIIKGLLNLAFFWTKLF